MKMRKFGPFGTKQPVHNGDVKQQIDKKLVEVNELKVHVAGLGCPACGHKDLALVSMEVGPQGWQAAVFCKCHAKGVLTNEGLHFDLPRLPDTGAKA